MVNDALVSVFNDIIFDSLAPIHFDSGSPVFTVIKWMFSIKEEIELIYNVKVVVFVLVVLYDYGELSLLLLQGKYQLVEGRKDLVLPIFQITS